jgi:hypothetical protein
MLFFVGEEVDLLGVVLEKVCNDAITDACGAAGDYIYLRSY